jgi:hypothetical protein
MFVQLISVIMITDVLEQKSEDSYKEDTTHVPILQKLIYLENHMI